jgi:hypothetical protein
MQHENQRLSQVANKTVKLRLPEYSGTSGLSLVLTAIDSGSIANGSGDTLTAGTEGLFSATVTEAITGWFDVIIKQSSVVIASGGKLFIESDSVGDYIVDDPRDATGLRTGVPYTFTNTDSGESDTVEITEAS